MLQQVDADLVIIIQGFRTPFLDVFFNLISWLGETTFYFIVLAAIYWGYNKRMAEFAAITLGVGAATNNILKNIFLEPRPFQLYPDKIDNLRGYTATGTSFPSGHVQSFSSLAFGLSYYTRRRIFFVVAIIMVALMGLSRIYLGAHFLRDTIVGGIMGFLVASFHAALYAYIKHKNRYLNIYYLVLVLAFLPSAFFMAMQDFFMAYGILTGAILAIYLEKKYVNFTVRVSIKTLAVRTGLGFLVIFSVLYSLGFLLDVFGIVRGTTAYAVLTFLRYFIVTFIAFFLYPMAFKRFNI